MRKGLVIAITPGVKLSGLVVVEVGAREGEDRLALAREQVGPEHLYWDLEIVALDSEAAFNGGGVPLDGGVTLLVEDRADDLRDRQTRALGSAGLDVADLIDVLKVQGFCEGVGRVFQVPVVRRAPFPMPRDAAWNEAWWELARHTRAADGQSPGGLVIDAYHHARLYLRELRRAPAHPSGAAPARAPARAPAIEPGGSVGPPTLPGPDDPT